MTIAADPRRRSAESRLRRRRLKAFIIGAHWHANDAHAGQPDDALYNRMHSLKDSRGYWDRFARRYDDSMRILGGPLRRTTELVEREIAPTDRVLEVAAGTGLITTALARRAKEVIATDYSAAMVEQVQSRGRREGWTNVVAEQRDLYKLGLPPKSFDVVVAANVLHLVPDLGGALEALFTATRPGGKVLLPTFLHAQTLASRVVSRVVAVTGFPSARRFDARTLRDALESRGAQVDAMEIVRGLIPIGFIAARPR